MKSVDAPHPVVALVGPPDMSNLSGGQRLLEQARNDLANHLDSQIMEQKVVLDNAQAELASNIEYVIANGKVALQNARNALDRRINLTLGNALQLASQYGIEPPPPSEIRTRTSYPPPKILQSAPGNSPQPPIDAANPYAGWNQSTDNTDSTDKAQINCETHLLPETQRESYSVVVERRFGGVVGITYLGDHSFDTLDYVTIIYPNWWSAHLHCRLVRECKWLRPRLIKYRAQIAAVKLGPIRDSRVSGPICTIANQLWPD